MILRAPHTPGPLYADRDGNIWRRPPADLYENGGGVAGDKPVAIAIRGWYNDGETGYPVVANALLFAAAPELLAAAELHEAALDEPDHDKRETMLIQAGKLRRAAIAKALSSDPSCPAS